MMGTLSACSDFFNVETGNVLDHEDYIKEESELYSGYIGIMTKVQAIGDKVIYLTDTRGELLEPTSNTPNELYSIYNYETDLVGNKYANPAPYYDVIIACNEYLSKLYDYKTANPTAINLTHYKALISCTLRVKAWIYLTLGKIYGEAIWFDDPIREMKGLNNYPVKNLDEIVVSCLDLLTKGFDGVDATNTMSWKEWLDPDTDTGSSTYRYWDYMTPEFFPLYAELCLWHGDYQKTVNVILNAMNAKFASTVNDATQYMHNVKLTGTYSKIWDNTNPQPQETISAIIYSYKNNQTNSLLTHFGIDSPNEYLLAPSQVGLDRYTDPDFDPLGGSTLDRRASIYFANYDGKNVVCKYRPRSSAARTYAYQDDVHIYIYRGSELYFMLAEALNNLGRVQEASALINQGVNGSFPNGGVTWTGFTDDWTGKSSLGSRKYPDMGIGGAFNLGNREFKRDDIKANDAQILNEMMLEFPAEGKIYPAMIRMARRYNDLNIISDRVCPKYKNPEEIRAKISADVDGKPGYFVHWKLK